MAKKRENVLSLSKGSGAAGFSVADSVVPVSDDHASVADQRRVRRHVDLQLAGSAAQQQKTLYGEDLIAEIQVHTAIRFLETARTLSQIRDEATGADYQPYVEEFVHHLMDVSAQQLLGCAKIGATAIARVMASSPFPPPEPARLTWLGRLLVKADDGR